MPERFPGYDLTALSSIDRYPDFAAAVLEPFLEGDALAESLAEICARAFDFPVPLVSLPQHTALLELFHGPTAAFKDFGARFLAHCLERCPPDAAGPRTILVATSGDTGAAVAAACHGRPGLQVAVLYPQGGVAPRQEQQLTCWDGNVQSFAVRGTFDDCQRIVKEVFRSGRWPGGGALTSANSINVGRLLPQVVYHAWASLRYEAEHGTPAGVLIPSGNVGNAVGAFWARRLGFPLRAIGIATNANRVIPDFFGGAPWQPRASQRTLANAMDVGDPSNMERLFDLFPDPQELRSAAHSETVDDDTIRRIIREGPTRWGQVFCPHTATAVALREQLGTAHWVVVATAHPAKFDSIVEPLIGAPVPVPPPLATLLDRPRRVTVIDPTAEALRSAWSGAAPG